MLCCVKQIINLLNPKCRFTIIEDKLAAQFCINTNKNEESKNQFRAVKYKNLDLAVNHTRIMQEVFTCSVLLSACQSTVKNFELH